MHTPEKYIEDIKGSIYNFHSVREDLVLMVFSAYQGDY